MNGVLSAFANAFVLGGLLTVAVGILLRLLPKQALNAATRYLVWWVTLALVIASPLLYLSERSIHSLQAESSLSSDLRPMSPSPTLSPGAGSPALTSSAGGQEAKPSRGSVGEPSSGRPARKFVEPALLSRFPVKLTAGVLPQLLLLTLLFSSGLMVARMIVSSLALEHRKRRAQPAPATFQGRADEWLSECGSKRQRVRLLSSSEISNPMAVGPYRPAILVPASLFDRLPRWELEQVGLHEAAHLARCDDYALLLQRLIEAVFVWNPLVRWIARRIELEREMACDDMVVAITGEPRDYATCLTNMAEWGGKVRRSLVAAGATQEGKQLGRRVETLLDKSRQQATEVLRLRAVPLIAAQVVLVFWVAALPGVVTFAEPAVQNAAPGIEQAIAAQAIRLETVEAGHGFADMQPLKNVIGNARIVALGEATHGTREFFQLKHRMVEFLATEMGFTIFSIEANMPEAYRLNDYVLNGRGDPTQLLKGMYFWTWDTEEVLDMILWMRDFNKSGKGRIDFTGFDMQTPDFALGIVNDFVAKNDPAYLKDLSAASTSAKTAARQGMVGRPGFGVATWTFPVKQAAGKQVRYSGYVRTADVTRGFAGLWWRVDGKDGKVLAFDNMQTRGAKGTTDWQQYVIELPVAADAVNINFGALHTGDGRAWFDGLNVELDGEPFVDQNQFDFDFESGPPMKFYSGGLGYQVFIDKHSSHSGGQSLQMQYAGGPQPTQQPKSQKLARATWEGVVRHLEQSAPDYDKKGVDNREVRWAVQNARVVLQCLQMLTNEVSRDESMAANVKWILDQSPGAKIVLWAHNGHVARGGMGGYQAMGSHLGKVYGNEMVVFGFTFNQGSFQAVQQGGMLKDFTVPPAPPGSLDATLASVGAQVLALDMRRVPSGSPLGAWLGEPHKTRFIGALYSDDLAFNALSEVTASQSYDALLFVEKTTAARKNAASEPPIFVPKVPPDATKPSKSSGQEYRDDETGVSFALPADLSIQQASRWGDRETTVIWLNDPGAQRFAALYFKIFTSAQDGSPDAVMLRLRNEVEPKVAQRIGQGIADYRIDMKDCRASTVGGRPALSCRATYTSQGQPMGEYLTWVGSANSLALFFGRAPATEFDSFRAQFDGVIQTLKIP